MRVIDISMPIKEGMPLYPGDPPLRLEPWTRRANGDDFEISVLRMGTHTGTHVDAPAHCIAGGATVGQLPLDVLCGRAHVLDLAREPNGLLAALAGVPHGCERLLLKTRGEGPPAQAAYPPMLGAMNVAASGRGLSRAEAAGLIERGIRLVGIDRLSVATEDAELAIHRLLLSAGVIIVEGLVLEDVPAGDYDFYCLPLALVGADGAPARAILRTL